MAMARGERGVKVSIALTLTTLLPESEVQWLPQSDAVEMLLYVVEYF
jgi:hypothetical protein